jgi:HAD superfamily hydrolase (TIGR01509 family)
MSGFKAFIFDQDGTIIDTEKDGHRVAFNRTFAEFGFDITWDVDTYHELLQIAGGKERMRHYFNSFGDDGAAASGRNLLPEVTDELIKKLHKRKTEIFIELLKNGELPPRPGVVRIMKDALARGIRLGICTTSNEKAAEVVAGTILQDIDFDFVLAGDIVSRKKPDPEIYRLALDKTDFNPEDCLVFEDSRNGVEAAKAAGMPVVATTNVYTEKENLSSADIIITSLGDPGGEQGTVTKGLENTGYSGILKIDHLLQFFGKK